MTKVQSIENLTNLVVVRGAGDIATGIIHRLHRSGFPVIALESEKPSAIRRMVALSQAVYEGQFTVEDMTGVLCKDIKEIEISLSQGKIPILVDPSGIWIDRLQPMAVVDAILAKKNLGTHRNMAPITIGVGPGFAAGKDVHGVVETMRGNDLGRFILSGTALPNTGIPGSIAGVTGDRVIHSPGDGVIQNGMSIGTVVQQGDLLGEIRQDNGEMIPITATIPGVLRGMIVDGYRVHVGFKLADIDPRLEEVQNCYKISDKARAIGGGVLEGIMYLSRQRSLL